LKIVLGVCGSIAAYKAATLTRLLVKDGHEVKVILTDSGKAFITPLTLGTLSKNQVYSGLFDEKTGEWVNHVALAHWADLLLIAPLSANTLAKMANGMCDNLLLAVYLSATCPVYVAPAMDRDMYLHPSVQANLVTLQQRGHHIIPPGEGELASGLEGIGRMAEPEEIFDEVKKKSPDPLVLAGYRFLVTAGPTFEPIDPVRYIGNHSSGKMGFAIAERLADMGAEVILVAGPVHLSIHHPHIKKVDVQTAEEMYQESVKYFPECKGAILAAAVADFKMEHVSDQKIKKTSTDDGTLTLNLIKNKDILSHLGTIKQANQLLIGFSLETQNEMANAREKMLKKNCDIMVLNSLRDPGAGFSGDTNKISILAKNGETVDYPVKPKNEVAADIVEFMTRRYF